MKPSKKSPQHRDFADRLCIAYDRVTDAPAKNYGQLAWLVTRVAEVSGERVTQETARKWLAGEARPRKKSMEALASILRVSSGWLDFGDSDQGTGSLTYSSVTPASDDQETILVSRKDLNRLEEIGKGLFTPGEIISRLLSNIER